ncbi:GntR family transcriptional regulator [Nitrincola sp. A-D6]|uniref:GntR family transcriptional regulator n=1 Tax=Nitrincola sp. A-D6 TaxID=1545442 RepID=UPI00051FAAF0|nr:GntR family transcriptional regulator [Nitrincola sp. A-D6]KGK43303.1 GntR family transcriptional regulator [Nitrincola sp. A-D6]
MNYPISEIHHARLGSSIYALLRDALITGRFKPNDRLRIRELAEQLSTSVTPVRDAILQLAKEQALEMRSPRDIRVPQLSQSQYDEIRLLRLSLEGMGAEQAAQKISTDALQQLRANIDQNHSAILANDMSAALRLNSEFHLLLADAAGMPLLRSVIDMLWMRTGPLIAQSYRHFSEQIATGHHEELWQALACRNSEAARTAIQQDILDGNQKMSAFLRQDSESTQLG